MKNSTVLCSGIDRPLGVEIKGYAIIIFPLDETNFDESLKSKITPIRFLWFACEEKFSQKTSRNNNTISVSFRKEKLLL